MKSSDIDNVHVVRLAQAWSNAGFGGVGVVAALMDEGIPYKLAVHKVERLSSMGLLDYGVSPHYAWPTPEGLALLDTPHMA